MFVYKSNHQPHLMHFKTFNSHAAPMKKGTCTLTPKTVWLQKPNILIEET